jgi:hypothetical protein
MLHHAAHLHYYKEQVITQKFHIMKTTKSLLSIIAATAIFVSCKKDSSGPAGVKFQLKATNKNSCEEHSSIYQLELRHCNTFIR